MSNGTDLGPRRVLPPGAGVQCPLCGTPVTEARVAKAPTGEFGAVFDCCGNLVTMACLRDAFGWDVPDYEPTL